ncbi:hypothetical protein K493DRAFT_340288 [Basidiobolus meristosporus CBS 931.73]|uniref:Uncharacterized protein n=1 Tax=Basidiobolus meristosporus CBS 931.73 TaxID=1314790 RepID=A0A1Y1XW29_9FUNG|nr:hypothetical protein K493DRAFT_340288 [Basidiobolus meristosporus CBS 931.73]|eukprot:ORX89971.1 hypothetical protein K493DRAFT_340288 [Basidiobolus meristosporus CBS 931.73]
MSGTVSLGGAPPLADIYDSSQLIRKKHSSSSFSDSEEENNPPEDEHVTDSPFDTKTYPTKPTTPTRAFLSSTFSHANPLLTSPTVKKPTLPTSPQHYSSMVRQHSANIHSIFNKLNTLNEKTRHDDKRSFLHSIKGHMRKNSKDKFSSLFDPFEGGPLSDTWRGSPLQPFSADDVHRSPITSPHSPLKSPTLTSYPTFNKLASHSKRRLTHDNTVEELAREMEQYYFQNNQKIESYIDQIATLEKQKRDAVLESKQWKKQCIYAENKLHSQELEFQEEMRNLSEQHQNDLDMIKGIHRKKCKQYGEIIKKLMATNEAFRAQLQEYGIVPVTANPEAEMLVETQEWAEDREFIQQKLAAIEQRKLASKSEEEMAASIEYITLALGMELRQNQAARCQKAPQAAAPPLVPASGPTMTSAKLKTFARKRSSHLESHEKRPDNYFSLRIGKERRRELERVTTIYHKTDHRKLTDDSLHLGQSVDADSFSDDSESSADEASIPLQFITTSRGRLDRRSKRSINPLTSTTRATAITTPAVGDETAEDQMSAFQFKPTEVPLKPLGQGSSKASGEKPSKMLVPAEVDDTPLCPNSHTNPSAKSAASTEDEVEMTPAVEEKPLTTHDPCIRDASVSTPLASRSRTSTSSIASSVSPSRSVFAKNRNPIRSASPCQRTANRLSMLNSSPGNGRLSTTPEQSQHLLAQRKKPLPKIPEAKSENTPDIQTDQDTQ